MNTAPPSDFEFAQVTGPLDVKAADQPDTLAEYISQLVQVNPDGRFLEIGQDGEEQQKTFAALFAEAQHLAARISHLKPEPGQFVVLCFESVLNYVPAAWACLLNGFSILPLSISGFFRNRAVLDEKMKRFSGQQGAFLVLSEPRFQETFELICQDDDGITVMETTCASPPPQDMPPPATFPDLAQSSAILVETSGTTGTPKLARIGGAELIARFFGGTKQSDIVNLALLGQNTIGGVRLLLPVGALSIYMDPGRMMADTGVWLDLVARFKVTHVGLSNSMAAKLNDWFDQHGTDWDLSSLKGLFFGSEMIVPSNIRKLVETLEHCGMSDAKASLVYSMTETGPLFVATIPMAQLYERSMIYDGYFHLDKCCTSWTVRIVDENGSVLPKGAVGSIQAFSTTRMFQGYHPEGDGIRPDGWFDTGDLGSIDHNGLVLTGRMKSTIIINAQKFSVEAIELALADLEGITPGMIAAAPYRDENSQTDELALFFTPTSFDPQDVAELSERIRDTVSVSIGVKISHLVAISEDQFARTPSGKIKRNALCDAYRDGAFVQRKAAPPSPTPDPAEMSWLQDKWRQILKLTAAPAETSNFFAEGGDSVASIELLIAAEKQFNCRIPLEKFYQNPTFANLRRLTRAAIIETDTPAPHQLDDAAVALALRKHEALSTRWIGSRAVPDGLVAGRNVMGRKPPLFWVFQEETEFNALAAQLDPDQPIYGIRSLVGILETAAYSADILKPLCKQILLEILALRPTGPLFIGGNCQGAIIALHLARQLQQIDRTPELLVLMEWMFSHGHYEAPTLFLYGQNSHTNAVFSGAADHGPNWRADFPHASTQQITGAHGQYFFPASISNLADTLNAQLDVAPIETAPCIKRIVMHWTAGRHSVSVTDRSHYHEIVSGSGERVKGIFPPGANLRLIEGQFAPHTKDLNCGSVGLSMAAMFEAQECPFYLGDHAITDLQLRVFCEMVAEYCARYQIPVTRQTVLTHAEVQPTLGVKQRGKWDITILPGMTCVGDPVEVGDQLRRMIQSALEQLQAQMVPASK